MILAIDFDDTLHDTHNVKPGYKLGQPTEGAVEALRQLKFSGHRIVIHSVWGGGAMAAWLRYFGVPYDEIATHKPKADFYIDDKAITFQGDWPAVLKQLTS